MKIISINELQSILTSSGRPDLIDVRTPAEFDGVHAAKFASAGFENCVVVDGGTQAWADAGLPVERSEHTVLPLDRQVQVAIGSIVLAGVLLSQFVNHSWIWLPGFVGCGLIFAGLSDICMLRMLMARMPWNQVKMPTKSRCPTA